MFETWYEFWLAYACVSVVITTCLTIFESVAERGSVYNATDAAQCWLTLLIVWPIRILDECYGCYRWLRGKDDDDPYNFPH